MMRSTLAICLSLSAACYAAAPARGDFAIDLKVTAGKASKTAHADVAGIGVKPKPRLVLEAKAGEPVTVAWTLQNTGKATVKDVVVHFFAVKEEKAGQEKPPKLNKDVAGESALTMDFKPKDKAEGELNLSLPGPGAYLIRVETIGVAAGKDGNEFFAALDVVVR